MSTEEKRKEERTVIELPLAFEDGKGVTRNLSASGMFFWTDSSPAFAVGDRVAITLEVIRSGRKIRPKCEAEIVRIEPRGKHTGVGLRIVEKEIDEPAQ
jgi:hypothetical protein